MGSCGQGKRPVPKVTFRPLVESWRFPQVVVGQLFKNAPASVAVSEMAAGQCILGFPQTSLLFLLLGTLCFFPGGNLSFLLFLSF